MLLSTILFYFFATVTVGAALAVISFRNPVHSVLSLILAFFSSSWLFIMLGAEFIAMLLIIVYVGAVAVLFLFVIMMLDVNYAELKEGFLHNLPAGTLVGVILFLEIAAIMYFSNQPDNKIFTPKDGYNSSVTNTEAIGKVLYTDYFIIFQMAGLVLLVAMVGAIVLTLHHKTGVKRQNIVKQQLRSKKDSVRVVKVKTGGGV